MLGIYQFAPCQVLLCELHSRPAVLRSLSATPNPNRVIPEHQWETSGEHGVQNASASASELSDPLVSTSLSHV